MTLSLGLDGRVVVVTGATRGIGRATAEALAAAGARPVVCSRKADDAESFSKHLRKAHDVESLGVACDVANPDDVAKLFQRVDSWDQGPLFGLVNNAGYPWKAEWWNRGLGELSPAEIEAAFGKVAAVDVGGARLCTWHALARMGGGAAIVFVSSTPAISGYKGTPYTEAKAAVLGLMRDVAREAGPRGIRANAVALGNIRTDSSSNLDPATFEALKKEAALERWGDPADAAKAIVFLLSDLAGFVTGQTLIVDGGTVMR